MKSLAQKVLEIDAAITMPGVSLRDWKVLVKLAKADKLRLAKTPTAKVPTAKAPAALLRATASYLRTLNESVYAETLAKGPKVLSSMLESLADVEEAGC